MPSLLRPFLSAPNSSLQEAPIQDYLDNLAQQLDLPPGSLALDSISNTTLQVTPTFSTTEAKPTTTGALHVPTTASGDEGVLLVTALEPNASASVDGHFTAAWMRAQLAAIQANQSPSANIALAGVPSVTRSGVCGNGVCELGERPLQGVTQGTCPSDCGFTTKACPNSCSSTGTCLPAFGTCACFSGYQGNACDTCAAGYVRSKGLCMPDVVALGLSANLAATNGVPPTPGNATTNSADGQQAATSSGQSSGGSGPSTGTILGAVFGTLGLLAVLAAAFILVRRRRAQAFAAFGSRTPTASGGTASGDIESQRYFSTGAETSLREQYSRGSLSRGGSDTAGGRGGSLRASQSGGAVRDGGMWQHSAVGAATVSDSLRQSQAASSGNGASSSSTAAGTKRHTVTFAGSAAIIAAAAPTALGSVHDHASSGVSAGSKRSRSSTSGASSAGADAPASALDSSILTADDAATLEQGASMAVLPGTAVPSRLASTALSADIRGAGAKLGHYER